LLSARLSLPLIVNCSPSFAFFGILIVKLVDMSSRTGVFSDIDMGYLRLRMYNSPAMVMMAIGNRYVSRRVATFVVALLGLNINPGLVEPLNSAVSVKDPVSLIWVVNWYVPSGFVVAFPRMVPLYVKSIVSPPSPAPESILVRIPVTWNCAPSVADEGAEMVRFVPTSNGEIWIVADAELGRNVTITD